MANRAPRDPQVAVDEGRPSTNHEAGDAGSAEMDEALDRLDAAVERVCALGDAASDGSSDSPVGSAGEAGENRAIRHARASFARRDAARAGAELAEARDRMRVVAERARRSTDSSREERRRRADGVATRSPLADALDRAARGLIRRGEDTVEHTLRLIVHGAVASLEHATHAGISLLEQDGTISSHAPSDPVVADLDVLQATIGEGPCHDAVRTGPAVVTHDLAAEPRWTRFAPEARRRGVASMLSLQLFARDDGTAGALNLYADRPGVFDHAAVEVSGLFASHAALVLHGARRTEQLTDALRSRDVIGQAKGILIERFSLSDDQAFAMLVSSSQDTNLKLRAVAEWVVAETARKHRRPGG